jgi:hypothetical protein
MVIRFHPDADAELAEAREWYAHQREDLDFEFMQCIDEALSQLSFIRTSIQSSIKVSDAPLSTGFPLRCFMNPQRTTFRLLAFFIRRAILKS